MSSYELTTGIFGNNKKNKKKPIEKCHMKMKRKLFILK